MKIVKLVTPLLIVIFAVTASCAVLASGQQRYLHVRVNNPKTHQLVRVNVPLSLAEKVIPAINHGQLRNGKVDVGNHFAANGINVKMILDALKTAPEGEFVTVQQKDNNVRVAKEHGRLVVHVVDNHSKQNVDVTVPWEVAQALASDTDENQLNVEAAIKALESAGDMTLVNVSGSDENVRVWVDSRSVAD